MTIIPHFHRVSTNRHHDVYQTEERLRKKAEIKALLDEGMTRSEIADALGISRTTLGTRMNRYNLKAPK